MSAAHYQRMAIQPWDFIIQNKLGFMEGSVVAFVSCWREKCAGEDLQKSQDYIEKMLVEIGRGYRFARADVHILEMSARVHDFALSNRLGDIEQEVIYGVCVFACTGDPQALTDAHHALSRLLRSIERASVLSRK